MVSLEKEWFIEAPWGKICVIAWGDCYDPPVLLCHGEQFSAVIFRPIVKLLPKNFYYIGIEFPGCGRSDRFPPGLPIHAHDMAYAIARLVQHFRWRHFSCIAISLGTLFAKIYALSYPDKITKLIELNPMPLYRAIITPEDFSDWYRKYFMDYYNMYDAYNINEKCAPCITEDMALSFLKNMGVDERITTDVMKRINGSSDKGIVKLNFDQRNVLITAPPLSAEQAKDLFTTMKTSTLSIITEHSIEIGTFQQAPYALDDAAHANRNYKHFVVTDIGEGVHFVSPFLLYGFEGLNGKCKL